MLKVLIHGLKTKNDIILYAKNSVFVDLFALCGAGILERQNTVC